METKVVKTDLLFLLSTVAMEDVKKYYRVLLYVENYGQIRPAEEGQGGGGRVQAEASLHS